MAASSSALSREGWPELLEPIVRRYRDKGLSKYFRGDAALARPQLYQYLENEGFRYAIRLAGNPVLLFVLAYNPGNFLRRLALPASIQHWSLRSIQTKLIKIGAKAVFHARRIIFQMAEVAVPKQLFSQILDRIWALAPG